MSSPPTTRAWWFGLVLLAACQSTPSDLREWTVRDHDHTTNPSATQVEVGQDAGSPLASHGIDEVTLVTWKQNCVVCHGTIGAGDGPQGAMTGVRNLTDPAWQASATDDSIARTIREGRGRMPAFKLPEPTIQALVRLVRLFDPNRKNEAAPHAAPAPTTPSVR